MNDATPSTARGVADAAPLGLTAERKYAGRILAPAAGHFDAACRGELGPGEGYVSAVEYARPMADHYAETGGCAGYVGPCSSARYVWVDLDHEPDPDHARRAAAALIDHVVGRYDLAADDVLAFLSGVKGFHVGVPAVLFGVAPHPEHPRRCDALASALCRGAGLDPQYPDHRLYQHVQLFRRPNSWHPGGRIFKVRVPTDHLADAGMGDLRGYAERPRPFDSPDRDHLAPHDAALEDWARAGGVAGEVAAASSVKSASRPDLYRTLSTPTLAWMQWGDAGGGSRHDALRIAASNLAEWGEGGDDLAEALLLEGAALAWHNDVPPDALREIDNGRERVRPGWVAPRKRPKVKPPPR